MSDEQKQPECGCVPIRRTMLTGEAIVGSVCLTLGDAPDCCRITAAQFSLVILAKTAGTPMPLQQLLNSTALLYETMSDEQAQAHLRAAHGHIQQARTFVAVTMPPGGGDSGKTH